ncbi:unnamed protein product [Phaedon cochleariae]|uniref:Uncharacterized protein n=1 Tax=Phaedon cochleariae TaxID=80249 RepID=A0A9N9SDJ6_PHACE|nr:unnamed protein product [Phaedon cochleariae]
MNCGQTKGDLHNCLEDQIFCCNCKNNNHKSTSRDCPTFQKQKSIKNIMATFNMSFVEAENYAISSYSSAVNTANTYQILSNLSDENFPSLPKQDNTNPSTSRPNNLNHSKQSKRSTHISFSQPSHSNYEPINITHNKKRKAISPPAAGTQHPPMFSFSSGPQTPLPPNPLPPQYHNIDRNSEIIIDTVFLLFENIVKKITNVKDLKSINNDELRTEILSILENAHING